MSGYHGISLYGISRLDERSTRIIAEAMFSQAIVAHARGEGWLVHYERVSGHVGKDGSWKGSGPKGKPDLTLARDGVVILAELKKHGGRVSPEQKQWLAALGPRGRLWYPSDASRIIEELASTGGQSYGMVANPSDPTVAP